jgi:hypothetical protein
MPLYAQIYLITNSFGGRKTVGGSYADLLFFGYTMKKSAKAPRYPLSIQLGRAHSLSPNKSSCNSHIYTFQIRVLGTLILACLPSH